MKLDQTTKRVLVDIQNELKEEMELDISLAELNDVITSQFTASVYAFSKGVHVRLPKIGRFERKYTEEIVAGNRHLREFKKTHTKEEVEAEKLRLKLEKKERAKARRKDMDANPITLDELISRNHNSAIKTKFTKFNKGEKADLRYVQPVQGK